MRPGGGMSPLAGHLPTTLVSRARHLGRRPASEPLSLAITLAPSDPAGLTAFVTSLSDPHSPNYHRYLTPAQFRARFAASDADIAQVSQFLSARQLSVTKVHANGLVVDVQATTADVEAAFQTEIHQYLTPDQRVAYAPLREPLVPDEIGSKLIGINGLSDIARRHPHLAGSLHPLAEAPNLTVGDYMTPAKIQSAYGLSGLTQTGAGQKIALFELDGYTLSDVTAYASYFGITPPPLTNVLVDSFSGAAGANAIEVTLDIDMAMAIAPGVSSIVVYEGPNSASGLVDTYSKIATQNAASVVSTSWGLAEDEATEAEWSAEATIFAEMAAQGQSIFVASGDSGAYSDPNHSLTLEVEDPASQLNVTAVGGTTLTLNGTNGYQSESSWGTSPEGGGGGISTLWSLPTWQAGLGTTANLGSTTYRMVPDVSLDANPTTGYPIIYQGQWAEGGGTSFAAPIWGRICGARQSTAR